MPSGPPPLVLRTLASLSIGPASNDPRELSIISDQQLSTERSHRARGGDTANTGAAGTGAVHHHGGVYAAASDVGRGAEALVHKFLVCQT